MEPPVKRYSSHLRQTQVELTQRTIMEAMAKTLIESGPEGDAVKQVARRANVSERTIYRHYPSKEALWDAFLLWVSERVGLQRYPANCEEMVEVVPAMFQRFDEHSDLLRACLEVRAWSDVWLSGRAGWFEGLPHCLETTFGPMDEAYREKVGAVVHMLFSGLSWKTMLDQWGFSSEQAAHAVQWSLQTLFDEVAHELDVREHDGHPPRLRGAGRVPVQSK